jgi:hypothetical protein
MTRLNAKISMFAAVALIAIGDFAIASLPPFVGEAQARIGHPLTPGSVAGVSRRTTRRTIHRTTVYVTRLPTACVKTSVGATVLWRCGGAYYQPYHGRYVVVHVR